MQIKRFSSFVALLAVVLAMTVSAGEKKSASKLKKAPGFKLSDQNGKLRSLEEFTKKGSVALVFYRSADW